ncbi:LysR family transcriptional regulator [Kutzneria sp. CA-103260]|uniref:LysR family transcriptional regulator n=1 Tax=Kutzneria sp. CA-103260 TaxID=2802641 RepID=UPI001BA9D143|nr:LysR family transcriptional regulator [Kutzneria sp. CA-103260]
MDLTLRQLEIFVAVARTRSFTTAATELVVSQPVISRTISELERKLRTALLERTTRSVELTDDGKELLRAATEILTTYRREMGRFVDYRAGEREQVTVAVLPSIAAVLMPSALSGYLTEHPSVQVRLADGTNEHVLAMLQRGEADIAITEVGPASTAFALEQLIDDPLVAVLPPEHALAALDDLSWPDFAGESFIAFSPDSSIRRLTDLAFAQAGIEPTRRLETRTVATAGGMVAAGLGVSAMPELVLPLLSATTVVTRPLRNPLIVRKIAVHRRSEDRYPAAVQRLVNQIVRATRT